MKIRGIGREKEEGRRRGETVNTDLVSVVQLVPAC